jgi:hypothetical protein
MKEALYIQWNDVQISFHHKHANPAEYYVQYSRVNLQANHDYYDVFHQ